MYSTKVFETITLWAALACVSSLFVTAPHRTFADDWPTYQHDHQRSGVTTAALPLPLVSSWVVRSPAEPRPAWAPPQPGWTELPKVEFDNAFYTVADQNTVYFGSSVENKVVAIDARTGVARWEFFTSGPVRLAPTIANDRIYFGADDGRVYCLRRDNGELVWSYDAAPRPERVFGNGRVTSLWPVRTNVVVMGDRVFFGAGIFPYHKVFLVSLAAATGEELWRRSDLTTYGGLSPQGYLLATADRLVIPSGRASPICVRQDNGDFVFQIPHSSEKGGATGAYGTISENVLFVGTQNTLFGTNLTTEKGAGSWTNAARIVAAGERVFLLKGPPAPAYGRRSISTAKNEITCIDRSAYRALPKKDAESVKKTVRWRLSRADAASLILAGKHLVVGGANEVLALDRETGNIVWEGKVDGTAVGLTVAHGRLLVSTTTGAVHCFAAQSDVRNASQRPTTATKSETTPSVAKFVADVVRETNVRRGFAVVAGHDPTAVACELARQTELQITCIVPASHRVHATRQAIAQAGLYGHRVTVVVGTPSAIPFPVYGANLVLRQDATTTLDDSEALRILKPCGGVLLTAGTTELAPELQTASVSSTTVTLSDSKPTTSNWTKLVRAPLAGSGWWTHQFADAGNRGSSGDKLVKGKLEVLWFGEPGPDEFPDRHQRGPSPLIYNGRVFCQGWNFLERQTTLFCFDAYNGLRYWKRDVEGDIRLGLPAVAGNLACDEESVYIAAGSKCTRYSATTGETLSVMETPSRDDGSRPDWGYLAVANGLVVGSAADEAKSRFSDRLFAFEVASGKQRWLRKIVETRDTTIAIHGGRVFFVENRNPAPVAPVAKPSSKFKQLAPDSEPTPAPRTIVAINLADGQTVWERDADLVDCGRWDNGMWGSLQMLCHGDVLVLAGAYTIYPTKVPQRPRRALALSTADGRVLWNNEIGNRSRPVMMHDSLLAEPLFYDLQTGTKILKPLNGKGKEVPWSMGPRTGGCGSLSASDCMVFGRGGYTIWRNVESGPSGTFIGTRPGCFINIIPAGGVVVQAEASSGCSCYQAVQSTIVFRPSDTP